MQVFEKIQGIRPTWSRITLGGDVNGLALVIGVLVAMMVLTSPSEAQCVAFWDWL